MLMRALVLMLSLTCVMALSSGCKKDRSRPTPSAADAAAAAQAGSGAATAPADGGAAQAAASPAGDAGGDQADTDQASGDSSKAAASNGADSGKPGADQGQAKGGPEFDPNAKPENIKVLPKSWNMGKVVDYMKKDVSAGLGVKCKFCHVKPFSADTVGKKNVARKMIAMTFEIDKKDFHGKPKVGCKTCHHGKEKPADLK